MRAEVDGGFKAVFSHHVLKLRVVPLFDYEVDQGEVYKTAQSSKRF